jgi:hypothetical protein
MTKQNQPLRNATEDALCQFGYPFEDMSGSLIFEVVTEGAATWRSQALFYEDDRFIEINVYASDELYPEDRAPWVAELAARFNDAIPAGAWVFRYGDEQDVRFRLVRAFRHVEEITADAIAHLIEQAAFPLKLWEAAFAFRNEDAVTPEIALEAAMIGEAVYSGDGLTKSARAAIMRAHGASSTAAQKSAPVTSAPPTPFLTLV